MKHVAGGYRDIIRHIRHEVRPKLLVTIGTEPETANYERVEPSENVSGELLDSVNGVYTFERHLYYSHRYMIPTWVVERIEIDDEEPAVHEYGYFIVHVAHFWSRIARANIINQMNNLKKTQTITEIEEALVKSTQHDRVGNLLLDYTQDASLYPVSPEVRPHEEG